MIGAVRERNPDFVFIAEAYWDLEYALQQQGFDYCYDKRLYDRLLHEGADSVHGHLTADTGYQNRLVRFIENHDEPRAAADVPARRGRARRRWRRSARRARGWFTTGSSKAAGSSYPSSSPAGPTSSPIPTCARSTSGSSARLRGHVFRTGDWQLGERAAGRATTPGRTSSRWGWRGDGRGSSSS